MDSDTLDGEYENLDLGDVIQELSREIPRILQNNPPGEDIVDMVEKLNNGYQPTLLKICTGEATEDEIIEWAKEEGLEKDQIDEVIDMMKNTFNNANQMAKTMDPQITVSPPESNNKEDLILEKLDQIISEIRILRHDVDYLLNNNWSLNN